MIILMPFIEETPLKQQAYQSLVSTVDKDVDIIMHQDKGEGWVNIVNQYLGKDDLILWHTDIIAIPGWYQSLMKYAAEYPTAGIIGTKLCFPDDTIQSVGGYILKDSSAGNVGRLELDFGQYDYVRSLPFVTFAGVLIRKSTADIVGKMDINYSPIYYDDVDYCLMAKEAGIEILYVPVKLYHLESQTTIDKPDILAKALKNHEYFKSKWKFEIRHSN